MPDFLHWSKIPPSPPGPQTKIDSCLFYTYIYMHFYIFIHLYMCIPINALCFHFFFCFTWLFFHVAISDLTSTSILFTFWQFLCFLFFYLLCDFCKQSFESMVRRLVFKRADVTQKRKIWISSIIVHTHSLTVYNFPCGGSQNASVYQMQIAQWCASWKSQLAKCTFVCFIKINSYEKIVAYRINHYLTC